MKRGPFILMVIKCTINKFENEEIISMYIDIIKNGSVYSVRWEILIIITFIWKYLF